LLIQNVNIAILVTNTLISLAVLS